MTLRVPSPIEPFALALPAALALLAAPAAQSVALNRPLVRDGDVLDVALAGERLVYLADQERNDLFELYSVPADASAGARKLNGPRPAGRRRLQDYENSLRASPDGAWVVYRADEAQLGVFELFRVPSDGSAAPTRLHPPLDGERDVELEFPFEFTPDGAAVLFLGDLVQDGRVELYRAPLDGSTPARAVNPPLAAGEDVFAFRLSPDGTRVALHVTRGGGNGHALLVRASDGSGPALLLTPERDDLVILRRWTRFSPDGRRLVYGAYFADGFSDRRVFSVPVQGILPPAWLSGRSERPLDVTGFELAADAARVVYHRQGLEDVLFSAPLDGREPALRLRVGVLPEDEWRLSQATGRVVFFELHERFGVPLGDVLSVPVGGGAPLVLARSVVGSRLTLSPDGSTVAFLDGNTVRACAVDGSTPLRTLNLPPRASERVQSLRFSERGDALLYVSDHAVDHRHELFLAPSAGDAPARRINDELVPGGDVSDVFLVSPSGERVFYLADQRADSEVELFVRALPRPHRGAR